MKYLLAVSLLLASFGSALADSRDTTITNVPFDFVIGNKTFPSGTYTISRVSDDPDQGLRIQSSDGKISAIFSALTAEPTRMADNPRLHFRRDGDTYVLTEISAGVEDYTVAQIRHRPTTATHEETGVPGAGH